MALLKYASCGDGCVMPTLCLVPLKYALCGDENTIPPTNIPPLKYALCGDEGGMIAKSISNLTYAISGDEPDMQFKNSCLSQSPWGKCLPTSKPKTEYVKTYTDKPQTPNYKGSLHNQSNQHHLYTHIGGMAKRARPGEASPDHEGSGGKHQKSLEPLGFLALDSLNDSLPAAGEEAEHDGVEPKLITLTSKTHAGLLEAQLTV
jgi:hypothetical protein